MNRNRTAGMRYHPTPSRPALHRKTLKCSQLICCKPGNISSVNIIKIEIMRVPYFPARSVLFHKEPNGVTYRVPALLYLPHCSSFLAFCEERLSPSDSQAHLLVIRRGTFYRNYVEWEGMHVLATAYLPGHRSMNPCPVYDEFTSTIFLFFIAILGHTPESFQLATGKNLTRLCYISSTDGGVTWSPVSDLTQQVIGDTIKEWATFALGPGHGIQLKSGRLLVPAYAYHIECKQCFGKLCQTSPHAFCFHSDTHGRTWRFGEKVPGPESVECQVVSVDEEDGTNVLYCNARSRLGYRVQAISLDDGATFQEGQLVQRLVEPRNGCHGSVVGFPAPLQFHSYLDHRSQMPPLTTSPDFLTPTWVVYSHPTWTSARKDLGVFLSPYPRDPDSWRGPWVIYEGPCAYSDLTYIELPPSPGALPPAVAFACLFECGARTAYDEISFCVFTLYELIDNLPSGDRLISCDYKKWPAPKASGSGHDGLQDVSHMKKKKRRTPKLGHCCSLS
ncbi:sialidase-4 isoform X2 [Dunckerocampus dactyliophorus]|uniref:sialidase-4 isoform X2 n=1 Tax=Dunckerocampus dactyliophorus TaxID=161453 RepID=UPI002404A122|nr:sialidase-4 isoform X2 [Dunckerocampus dactyliophorus]